MEKSEMKHEISELDKKVASQEIVRRNIEVCINVFKTVNDNRFKTDDSSKLSKLAEGKIKELIAKLEA